MIDLRKPPSRPLWFWDEAGAELQGEVLALLQIQRAAGAFSMGSTWRTRTGAIVWRAFPVGMVPALLCRLDEARGRDL